MTTLSQLHEPMLGRYLRGELSQAALQAAWRPTMPWKIGADGQPVVQTAEERRRDRAQGFAGPMTEAVRSLQPAPGGSEAELPAPMPCRSPQVWVQT